MKNELALFEEKTIRKEWKDGKWYFSVVDVIYALTDSVKPRDYWYRLKKRVSEEEQVEMSTFCRQLKLKAGDGKRYNTDCADTEGILRIIQSIPSPKAEPFKRWLSKVGSERIEEINDPELIMKRMRKTYERKGYSKSWIDQREKTILTRNNLTEEWKERGAKGKIDYAILTNEIYKSGFGISAKEYKKIKKITERENLRDSMTNIELALTNLGEAAAVEIHQNKNSLGTKELKEDVHKAGKILNKAKCGLEDELGTSIVNTHNHIALTKKEKE